jgi:hypothetical protein
VKSRGPTGIGPTLPSGCSTRRKGLTYRRLSGRPDGSETISLQDEFAARGFALGLRSRIAAAAGKRDGPGPLLIQALGNQAVDDLPFEGSGGVAA